MIFMEEAVVYASLEMLGEVACQYIFQTTQLISSVQKIIRESFNNSGRGGCVGPTESYPLVSIIIPTFNSENGIGNCLQSIKNQTYSNIEVIVVDRHSRDRTLKIAGSFKAKILKANLERSAARNLGAEEAKGSFLLFIDSDMELAPNVILECVESCQKEGSDAAIIPEEPIGKGLLYECRRIEKQIHVGDKLYEAPRFFKREVFRKLGGFDEDLVYGEDSELYTRMVKTGFKMTKIKSRIIHREGELTMKKIILKAYVYGKSLPSLLKKHPYLVIKKYLTPKKRYYSNIHIIFKRPLFLIILTFIKIIEYETYLIGILVSSLRNLIKV